ncbi:MAG: L-threonylcarbamoyladenylate synthase [Patescibacteria group bacterium]|nr:threonylcarbamoyl-AMP synthase [Patescibacteria group bacterium]
MEIVKLTGKNEDEVVAKAVAVLKKGGVIMYPTDTCYGFAVDIFNEPAFRKLYSLKEMPYSKPVSIMVSSEEEAKKYGTFFKLADDIADEFWPGPLTLVLKRKSSLPNFLNIGGDTVGIRVVDFPFVGNLVKAYGLPLTTTSANITGKKETYSVADFKKQFKNRNSLPDLVIDAGKLKGTKTSTVAAITADAVQIIREGKVAKKLREFVKKRK